jgi:ABC-type transporter Mla subunit MlaD
MNDPYRLRYTNQIVGMFLLLFLVFLIVLSLLVFRVSDRFGKKDRFWFQVTEAEIRDLHRGAEVMLLGERAGEVRSISYEPDQKSIRVELQIDRAMSDRVFEDSVVRLERKFGVGAPVLVIRRGGDSPRPVRLTPGSQIQGFQGESDRVDQLSREVESITESIRKIQESASPSLQSVDDAADRFRGSLDNTVDPAFVKTREASESFLETNSEFRRVTTNLESRIASLTEKVEALVEQDLRQTLAEVRQSSDDLSAAAQSVNQTSGHVDQDVAVTLQQMRAAIEQVRLLAEETRDVVKVVQREADDLPGTTARVNDTVSDTQSLVEEIRSFPLIRRYSNQPSSSQQVSPSSVRGGSVR